jgi:hypothetical protein
MASTKGYNCAVKVGSYTDKDGKQKNKYVNVGSVFKDDNGHPFMLMDRTFNPAGCPNPDNRDSVLISFFSVDDKNQEA